MLEIFEERPYLWATHVWNMFDFAADARDEGGCKGRNNKGLVTYDRKIKKDAFYLYKAYWTSEPMVHICGSRFVERAPGERNITVYTNCKNVTLEINGKKLAEKKPERHVVVFEDVPLADGENQVTAKAGDLAVCTISLFGTAKPNEAYVLPDDGSAYAGNWFDDVAADAKLEFKDGYFSIRDKICDLAAHPEASVVMEELFGKMFPEGQDVEASIKLMKNMALEPILTISKVPKGTDVYLNNKLNRIKK